MILTPTWMWIRFSFTFLVYIFYRYKRGYGSPETTLFCGYVVEALDIASGKVFLSLQSVGAKFCP